jgi:hypothetical protein
LTQGLITKVYGTMFLFDFASYFKHYSREIFNFL